MSHIGQETKQESIAACVFLMSMTGNAVTIFKRKRGEISNYVLYGLLSRRKNFYFKTVKIEGKMGPAPGSGFLKRMRLRLRNTAFLF